MMCPKVCQAAAQNTAAIVVFNQALYSKLVVAMTAHAVAKLPTARGVVNMHCVISIVA